MRKVLFVCLGNICRSPTAEGVFQKYVDDAGLSHLINIDSAGTGAWHIGKQPDPRATEAAKKRGYVLEHLRARKVSTSDFREFDFVLAMDHSNLSDLLDICPESEKHKVRLFLSYANNAELDEVPDPYYGGARGFEFVLDLVEQGAEGLLSEITREL